MVYVALLRGVNVGGKNIVKMADLKACFERLGFEGVRTYINSGNVIFASGTKDKDALVDQIEPALEGLVGRPIKVLLRTLPEMERLADALPDDWVNDGTMKCDVFFLAPEIDSPAVVDELPAQPEIEDVRYLDGAVGWRVDRSNQGKSRMSKIVGTDLHKQMSARNPNTVRKLTALMRSARADD